MFDISHAASEQSICIEEDKQFLNMQKESRSGAIGRVDKKKTGRDKRTFERKRHIKEIQKNYVAFF